ncbi:hypothetical protein Q5752_001226 [Cryptotrichosporon argae]
MFANLTYEDKVAFFSLLDEYFQSRPHLAAASSTTVTAASLPSPALTSARSRTLPPRSAASPSPVSPPASPAPASASASAEAQGKPDLASRIVAGSIKHSARGIGSLASNTYVNEQLGKVGAAGLARGVRDGLGGLGGAAPATTATAAAEEGKKAPPPPPTKKSGVAGLTSTKTFGHVDTSSKMSAFTSMFRDPQKAQQPATSAYQAPALPSTRASQPPPRRQPEPEQAEAVSAEGQAQALYDYEGGDAGDLPLQTGQIVNVLEKSSADWWTCEDGNGARGLVPANYLKEI